MDVAICSGDRRRGVYGLAIRVRARYVHVNNTRDRLRNSILVFPRGPDGVDAERLFSPDSIIPPEENSRQVETTMDKFVDIVEIESGLYGKIYRARQSELDRFVALKIIKSDAPNIASATEHANALARIGLHSNIVTVYDVEDVTFPSGVTNKAIIMEWLQGENLAERLAGPQFSREQAKSICCGMLDGIQFMHAAGVAHSDLHERNIVLVRDCHPKIIDIDANQENTLGRLSTTSREAATFQDVAACRRNLIRILQHTPLSPTSINQFEDEVRQLSDLNSIQECVQRFFRNAGAATDTSTGGNDVPSIIDEARTIARAKDRVAWRIFQRKIRSQFLKSVMKWRQSATETIRATNDWEPWIDELHELLDLSAALLSVALVSAEEGWPGVDGLQRDWDLLFNIPDWDRSGFHQVNVSPGFVVSIYQFVVGASFVDGQMNDSALSLAKIRVPIAYGEQVTEELWKSHSVMGHCEALGGNIPRMWQILSTLWERHAWIRSFFAHEQDFYLALRGYSLLCCLVEIDDWVRLKRPMDELGAQGVQSIVAPLFIIRRSNEYEDPGMDRVLASIAPTSDAYVALLAHLSMDAAMLTALWPLYWNIWLSTISHLFPNFIRMFAGRRSSPPALPQVM